MVNSSSMISVTCPCTFYVYPPVGWGLTYCFTDVGVLVGVHVSVTPITKGTPAHFFWRHVFCSLGHWLLIFAMTVLDICSQAQAVRAFFIGMGFSLFCQKYEGDFDQTCQEGS